MPVNKKAKRQVVQLACAEGIEEGQYRVFALCNDGSVWRWNSNYTGQAGQRWFPISVDEIELGDATE